MKLGVSQLWHYIETLSFHKDIKKIKDFADDITDDDDENNNNNNKEKNNDDFLVTLRFWNNFRYFDNFRAIWPFCYYFVII